MYKAPGRHTKAASSSNKLITSTNLGALKMSGVKGFKPLGFRVPPCVGTIFCVGIICRRA